VERGEPVQHLLQAHLVVVMINEVIWVAVSAEELSQVEKEDLLRGNVGKV